MNNRSSILCNAAVLLCAIFMQIFASADSAAASSSLSLQSSSSVLLPTRSDIMATLFHHHHQQQSRNLRQEDQQETADANEDDNKFASLNSVLSTVQLNLPPVEDAQLSGVDISITDLVCRDLTVDDIVLTHDAIESDPSLQRMSVNVTGVSISCTFRWEYSWMFLRGSGTGDALSEPTSFVSVDIDFTSENFDTHPPSDAFVSDCNTALQIDDMNFQDDGIGINAFVINIMTGFMTETIERELGEMVCEQVTQLGDDGEALDNMLNMLSEKIDKYLMVNETALDQAMNADPLSAEKNAQVPLDEEGNPSWINFVEVQDMIEDVIGLELNQFADSLMTAKDGEDGEEKEGGNIMAINAFMKDVMLDEDGRLSIDPAVILGDDPEDLTLIELHDMFTQTTMSIKSVSVEGLDSFLDVNILDPIGNYTLQNTLKLESLTFVLEVDAIIEPSSKSDAVVVAPIAEDGSPEPAAPIQETFNIKITADDVDLRFSLFLGLNNQTLWGLPLGSIIHLSNVLPCALSIVDDAEVTELVVLVGSVSAPELSGFLDAGTDHLITTGFDALYSMYEQILLKAMPNFFSVTIKDMLNDYIEEGLNDEDACEEPDSTLTGLVDYRDLLLPEEEAVAMQGRGGSPYGELFRGLYSFFDKILSKVDEDGLSWLNAVVAMLFGLDTNDDGEIVLAGDLISKSLEISLNGLNAAVEIGVSDVTVSNLNSLGALQLLQPMMGESSVLRNEVEIGVGPDPIRLSLTVLLKGKGDKLDMHNEFRLGLSLKDLDILFEMLAQMQEPPFLYFPLEDVTNLDCWMYTMVKPELDQYGVRIGEADSGVVLQTLVLVVAEARLDMECISCDLKIMLELEEAMQTQEGITDTTDTVVKLFDYGTGLVGGDYVQNEIDKMLLEAAYKCPHSPSYQSNFAGLEFEEIQPVEASESSNGYLIAIIAVIGVVAAFSVFVFFMNKYFAKRRHNRWLKTLSNEQIRGLKVMEQNEKELESDLNGRMNSLVTSKEVPCFVRLIIPVVLVGNIGLFLSGHLSLGGSVNISGNIGEETFNVDGFFEFSMAKSAVEMWQAGAKSLAILIGIFSGLWPYTKLLITLFLWFAPTRWITSKRRGKTLHWLDVLGKWSMVDVFVLLMTLVSFNISVNSPELNFLPEDLYSVNMMVVPMWGLYANMLAQLVAQLSSHVIIHYHRKAERAAAKLQQSELNLPTSSDTGAQEKLCAHQFKLDYEASTERAVVRKGVSWTLFAVLVSFIVLVICGCSLPSFSVEIFGLLGLAVESGNQFEQAKTYYSVFDLASMIMDQARYINDASSYVGLGTLASLLVITVFIVPLAQAASLIAQWFAPLTRKQSSRNATVNEILSAWQYMEVYVLSIIIAAWQLGDVSEYMLNAYCDSLKDTFASLAYFGILKEEDAQCFRVDATVEAASWVLVSASLILVILNHFVGKASLQKKLDDNVPAERRRHTDGKWLPNMMLPQSSDKKEGTNPPDDHSDKVSLSPIAPRFTDFYNFATKFQTGTSLPAEYSEDEIMENGAVESAENGAVESVDNAVLPKDAGRNGDMSEIAIH